MNAKIKGMLNVLSAVAVAPPECSECVTYCAEGNISCECRGDFHPETCEHSLCEDGEEE